MNSEMKGKLKRQRAPSAVEYKLETGAVNYQLEMEEEVLMQQLGLDRFLSVVAWDNNNPTVVAEVIENLDGLTYESILNGRKIRIFQEDWRRQVQSMFYLTPHRRDVETTPVPAKVSLTTLFPSVGKRKVRPVQVKISECGVPALKKPLRLLKSLLLLRTDASTIPLSFVERLVDAFNGKATD